MLVNHCCVKPSLTLYLLFESTTFIINLQSRNCLNFYFLFVLFCFGLFFRLFFFGAGCCGLVCWWLSCVNPSCVQALGATLFSNVCLTLDDQTPVIPKRKITNPCDGVCICKCMELSPVAAKLALFFVGPAVLAFSSNTRRPWRQVSGWRSGLVQGGDVPMVALHGFMWPPAWCSYQN